MSALIMHREEVKAAIRIRHGSIERFADFAGLKSQQVRDLLRGTSSGAKPAVATLLGVEADQLEITQSSTTVELDNTPAALSHRLNEGAR